MTPNKLKTAQPMVEGSGTFNDGVNNFTTSSISEWRDHVKEVGNLTQSGTLTCGICRSVAVDIGENAPATQETAICDGCKIKAGVSS